MKLAIAIVIGLALCSSGALADSMSRSCPYPSGPAIRGGGCVAGFELGVPPEGWETQVTVPAYTWTVGTYIPYEGAQAAKVPWTDTEYQDEWLKFQYWPKEDDVLEFATMGNPSLTPNANFYVLIDNVSVWDFDSDHTVGEWEWEYVTVPLGAYAGQSIEIAFAYMGTNGADHHLDAVNVHSFDLAVSDIEIVWYGSESFSIYPTLPVSSCISHDDVTTNLTYSIDAGVVLDQSMYYAGSFWGGCYTAAYPSCSGFCPDLGSYDGFCTDEYIAAGYYRCRCHWSTSGDDATVYAYIGQSDVTVAIDMTRNDVIESDETNNILTVPLIPPTSVETFSSSSWTTIKGLYR